MPRRHICRERYCVRGQIVPSTRCDLFAAGRRSKGCPSWHSIHKPRILTFVITSYRVHVASFNALQAWASLWLNYGKRLEPSLVYLNLRIYFGVCCTKKSKSGKTGSGLIKRPIHGQLFTMIRIWIEYPVAGAF